MAKSKDIDPSSKSITAREKMVATARLEFINALSHGEFVIVHKVNVHNCMGDGGKIDYNDENEEFTLKSASLSQKKDKDGGYFYQVKITVE